MWWVFFYHWDSREKINGNEIYFSGRFSFVFLSGSKMLQIWTVRVKVAFIYRLIFLYVLLDEKSDSFKDVNHSE